MKKKIFATLLAAVMTIASTVTAFAADEMSYDAGFSFSNSAWSVSVWGDTDTTKTTFTGEGTYTFTWTPGAAVSDCIMILVDIGAENGDAAEKLANYELEDVTLKLDGAEVDVDLSKVQTGNLENKGRYRVEVYNTYGGTKDNSPIDISAIKDFTTIELSVTFNDPSNDTPAGGNEGGNEGNNAGGNTSGGSTTGGSTAGGSTAGGTDTADVAPVAALVVLAAVAAAVVLKKRTVNE